MSMDKYLIEAIAQAKKSLREGGIPIGSVLVREDIIIGRGHNQRVQKSDPTAHAEIDCLRNAGRVGSYQNTVLYSTLMPCYYCAGAVVQFGIKKVVVGEAETFQGAESFMKEHGVKVINLQSDECKQMMREFIKNHAELWNEDIGR
jgi:cytosine deaminase